MRSAGALAPRQSALNLGRPNPVRINPKVSCGRQYGLALFERRTQLVVGQIAVRVDISALQMNSAMGALKGRTGQRLLGLQAASTAASWPSALHVMLEHQRSLRLFEVRLQS